MQNMHKKYARIYKKYANIFKYMHLPREFTQLHIYAKICKKICIYMQNM